MEGGGGGRGWLVERLIVYSTPSSGAMEQALTDAVTPIWPIPLPRLMSKAPTSKWEPLRALQSTVMARASLSSITW